MKKILKHGNKFVIFNCHICGCKFKAGPYDFQYYDYPSPSFVSMCPECQATIKQEVNKNE